MCIRDRAKPFFVVYSFVSILGATVDLGLLWSIADTFNGLMSIPNLIALLDVYKRQGKCWPISPSAAAPSTASITAWASTSASEWPSRPFSKGISTPPRISLRPSTRRCTS